MKVYSLKQIVDTCSGLELTDTEILTKYFEQTGVGVEALDTLINVLRNKIIRSEECIDKTKANLAMSTSFYYDEFPGEVASVLDTLTREMLLDIPFSEAAIEWIKKFDLSVLKPGLLFYHDLAEVIKYIQTGEEPELLSDYNSLKKLKVTYDANKSNQ